MARRISEQAEMRETYTEFDGTISETRFFKVSKSVYNWLQEHGQLAAISLCDWTNDAIISVSAFVEGGRWNGWNWLHDELLSSGLDPQEFVAFNR